MNADNLTQDSSIRWADELDDSDSGLEDTLPRVVRPTTPKEPAVEAVPCTPTEVPRQQKTFECHRADFLASDPQDVSEPFTRRNSRNNRKGPYRRNRITSPPDDDFSWRCSSSSDRGNSRSFMSTGSKNEDDRGLYGIRHRRKEENSSAW
ncbi:uncharacterized protein BXIN_3032 [Babesia sp. Xinjiang]|uniref:uncharacterized protein n=1 Tax=Babesia sp. Xinjiang TaxID=462227 RepID=UPI000A23D634|nr:uncharacterized protein BXIN_3032 [Babesia sp. Xinjiang]ORM39401.1 hypothetical protein BXIN_3032 [Babesia sp. Xinjiang]